MNRLVHARRRVGEITRDHGFGEVLRVVFLGKSSNGLVQLFRYGFVGLAAAIVDTGALLLLANVWGVDYIAANTVGFILGTAVNYMISVAWVFHRTTHPAIEVSLFVLIGVVGLGVSDLSLWVGVHWFAMDLLWAKVLAIVVGFLWNFALRKILFDRLGARLKQRAAAQQANLDTEQPSTDRV